MNNEETIKWIVTKEGNLIDLQEYNLEDQDDNYYYFLDKKTGCKLVMIGKSDVDRVYTKFTPNISGYTIKEL